MTIPKPRTQPTLLLFASLLAVGCGGPAAVSTHKEADASQVSQDPLESITEQLRRADDPVGCREALRVADSALEQDPEGKEKVARGAAALRALQDQLGLSADEVEEATAAGFQPLDAHHVYLCLLLRDAAESLRLQGLSPLKQAERAFAWVVRQVVLRSPRDDVLVPPEVVLQLGEGSAEERALVFLALLQQLDLDGCMLALPGTEGSPERAWIPGVVLTEHEQPEIYLFDTRLGVPVPDPGGRGVATLRQVQKDPELLARLSADKEHPYDVSAEQARRAEPRLVVPLTALAPRIRYLEDRLAKRDGVRLAADPAALLKHLAAAAGGKVGVWNRQRQAGGPPPWTPTRALRLFLPPAEGGVDQGERWRREQRAQLFWSPLIVHHYRQLKAFDDLPPEARDRLRALADRLFLKYILVPHARLTRGLPEDATKSLVRIEAVVQDFRQAPMSKDGLDRAIAGWRAQIKEAYLRLAHKEPDGQARVNALWNEDQYLLYLTDPSEEEAPPRLNRSILSFLVLKAAGGPLRDEALFLLGLAWQERAAGQQAGGDTAAWGNAEGLSREYAENYSLSPATVRERVQTVLAHWRWQEFNMEIALALWDCLFHDLRRAATARLFQAHALEAMGKEGQARQVLRQLAAEVAALPKEAGLHAALVECDQRLQQLPTAQQDVWRPRLQRCQRELEPGGGLYWLGQSARYLADRPTPAKTKSE
jgi:hypothetical protein